MFSSRGRTIVSVHCWPPFFRALAVGNCKAQPRWNGQDCRNIRAKCKASQSAARWGCRTVAHAIEVERQA